MSGAKKSFHEYTRWKTETAMITGHAWGMRTETRVRNGPAPSIAAASSISRGIVMKYWRIRKTSYALAKKVGSRSGSHAIAGFGSPITPSDRHTTYVGIVVTTAGRKIVESSSRNITFRPGKRN